MNILDELEAEHRDAETLVEFLGGVNPGPERRGVLERLDALLTRHMAMEEAFVHPLVIRHVGPAADTEAQQQHGLIRRALDNMGELLDSPGFAAAVAGLRAGLCHHIDEEETEVFPELRERAHEEIEILGGVERLRGLAATIGQEFHLPGQDADVRSGAWGSGSGRVPSDHA